MTPPLLPSKRKAIQTIRDERDSQDRQLVWTKFDDGSANSRELSWHHSAHRTVTETWREEHPAGSEMATLIHAMQ